MKMIYFIYDEKLVAANNTEIETLGKISLKMQLNQRSTVEDVIVFKNQDSFLLSWQVCKNLEIIPQNFPKPIQKIQVECIRDVDKLKQELIEEFSDVFNSQEELTVMLGEPMQYTYKRMPNHMLFMWRARYPFWYKMK